MKEASYPCTSFRTEPCRGVTLLIGGHSMTRTWGRLLKMPDVLVRTKPGASASVSYQARDTTSVRLPRLQSLHSQGVSIYRAIYFALMALADDASHCLLSSKLNQHVA